MDSLTRRFVGYSTDPDDLERLDQLALDCRMSLDYPRGYFMPEIINQIQIQVFGLRVEQSGVVLALSVRWPLTSLALHHGSLSFSKQNWCWNSNCAHMLMAPRTSADVHGYINQSIKIYIAPLQDDSTINDVQLHIERRIPNHDP